MLDPLLIVQLNVSQRGRRTRVNLHLFAVEYADARPVQRTEITIMM